MRVLTVRGVRIDNTFAEAFGMRATAVTITADTARWARQAATTMTGFATSVIGCGCEAGIDRELTAKQTPDRRPGVRILLFGVSTAELQKQLQARVAQCVLTSPGSACYAAIEGEEALRLGNALRYFGDGWQISKRFGAKHFWRIPVMDGEFVCEATTGLTKKAVGGGNLIIMGRTSKTTRVAAEAAAAAIADVPDVIAPFPGGIARSGSKVGSKYKGVPASTNDAYCPTLRGAVKTSLDADSGSVLEIVIDGLTSEAVAAGMRAGIAAIVKLGPKLGATRISAGNYGGKLGPHHYHLRNPVAVNSLTFTLRQPPDQRLDLSPLVPNLLSRKTATQIERIELQTTRYRVNVGDVFRLRLGDAGRIRIEGAGERLDRVGHAMTGGELFVDGDVGIQAGRLMAGGRLILRGNTGHWAASGMKDGVIEILGATGAYLGGPLAGETVGMRGGVVVVRGRAGERAGDRMRRGTIIIEGEAGAYAGSRMIAGTLIAGRKVGPLPGFLMKRGSIVLGDGCAVMSPTFVDCGHHELLALRLWEGFIYSHSKYAASLLRRPLRRLAGDMAVLGKGEIFIESRN